MCFVLESYNNGLEHIPKKNGNAHTLDKTLINVVRYYHIDDRIISISRDNASVMSKVILNFTNLYRSKGVDENFDGDIRCFGHVSNLSVKVLMINAFSKNIVADNDSLDNDDSLDDEFYVNLPMNVENHADKVRRFIVAVKKNDTLGNLFETAVAKRNQIDHSKREKLKREVSTRWLSE